MSYIILHWVNSWIFQAERVQETWGSAADKLWQCHMWPIFTLQRFLNLVLALRCKWCKIVDLNLYIIIVRNVSSPASPKCADVFVSLLHIFFILLVSVCRVTRRLRHPSLPHCFVLCSGQSIFIFCMNLLVACEGTSQWVIAGAHRTVTARRYMSQRL